MHTEDKNLLAIDGTAPKCVSIPYTTPAFVSEPTSATQDLRDYFSRERTIRSGTFSASAGNIFSDNVVLANFNGWYPGFLTRLTGVFGIRFTLNVTLRCSPTPFAQGISVLSFQYGADASATYTFDRTFFPFSCTQVPHVRLNFEETNEVTLSIPFLYSYDYFPLRDESVDDIPYGVFSLTNITPVPVAPSTAAIPYKVYLSLTDLELIGSTSWVDNTVLLNSGIHNEAASLVTRVKQAHTVAKKTLKGISTADKELRKSKVISSTLGMVGKGLDFVSKVPIIGSFAGTPAWLANSLAGTAAAFGYAAPAIEETIQLKVDRHTLDPAHIDVPIASAKLSPFQSNKLEVSEVLGACDEDAMAFSYVLPKPSQIYLGSMTTGQGANTLLYGTKISPYSFWYRSTGTGNIPAPFSSTATTNALYPSTVMYLADHFRYWRGGLRFHLTFAKTQFHAGQILVTYIPYAEASGAAGISNVARIPESPGGLTQPNQFSMIIDLRSGANFEFDVPFIFPSPYASVNDSTGSLSMVVLNPLVASSTSASSTINFVVEVSAKPDFEFAAVVAPSMCTTNTTVGDAFLQSGIEVMGNSDVSDQLFPTASIEPSASIIGEKFNSLKQLAMVPVWFAVDQTTATIANFTIPNWSYRPRWTLATPMSTTSQAELAASHAGKVASMFVFSNGSTRFTVQPQVPSGDQCGIVYSQRPNSGNLSSGIFSGFANIRNKRLFSNAGFLLSSSGPTVVDVPWYTKVMRVNHDYYNNFYSPRNFAGANTPVTHTTLQGDSLAVVTTRNTSGATRTFHFAYAAGEDATAACFIGPSPVILFNSLATVSPNQSSMFNDQ